MMHTCESVITWNNSLLSYNELPNLEGDCVCVWQVFQQNISKMGAEIPFLKTEVKTT